MALRQRSSIRVAAPPSCVKGFYPALSAGSELRPRAFCAARGLSP
eukprot:CAMPEP_0176096804 /NCGR_PEP_ID=MMETSP0120_2-20121206/48529_1 /TAXON_ID=160619 /ORGANISM="Kryptoperidinium foliaceum, Strain CCMP 1326" /LENGTH=44 /DNA_ID= /DNA_START= /DNA_END= /DNA_ORIENTATION=